MTEALEHPRRRLPRFSLRSLILFVALAGSGYGLWVKWEPWAFVSTYAIPRPFTIIDDNKMFLDKVDYSPDGQIVLAPMYSENRFVLDPKDGRILPASGAQAAFEDPRLAGKAYSILWDQIGRVPIDVGLNDQTDEAAWLAFTADRNSELQLWQLARPWPWYGVAWLPEFWLTVVLGVGLMFSLWRDSRIMRA